MTITTNKNLDQAIQALKFKEYSEAAKLSLEIINQDQENPKAHAIAFTSLLQSERLEEARQIGTAAAKLNPTSEFILNNQACLQLDAQQPAAAATLLKSLISQYGKKATWLYNLGLALKKINSPLKALEAFHETFEVDPEHDLACYQIAEISGRIGNFKSSFDHIQALRLLRPDHSHTHSNLIHYGLVYGHLTKKQFNKELKLWNKLHLPQQKKFQHDPANTNEAIGFYIGRIPLSWWDSILEPVIRELALKTKVVIYWNQTNIPRFLKHKNITLVDCFKMHAAEFAETVYKDKLHSLIDICGMRIGRRQRALSLQLAQNQYGWLAHEGAYAIDNIEIIEPQLEQDFFIKLDAPTEPSDKVLPNYLFANNEASGLCMKTIEPWSAILKKLPNYKLVLKAKNKDIQTQILKGFGYYDIEPKQLIFDDTLSPTSSSIILENTVYNDIVGAANSINSGARIIALNGSLLPEQQTSTLLKQLGLEKWIISSRENYVEQAIELIKSFEEEEQSVIKPQLQKLQDVEAFSQQLMSIVYD